MQFVRTEGRYQLLQPLDTATGSDYTPAGADKRARSGLADA
jgi:hypothetical protein